MRADAQKFYSSKAWQRCRDAYKKRVGGLCERCLKEGKINPAEIIHHKIHLDESKLNDPSITLCFENLEALCRECHEKEHGSDTRDALRRWRQSVSKKRYTVDQFGHVKCRETPPS